MAGERQGTVSAGQTGTDISIYATYSLKISIHHILVTQFASMCHRYFSFDQFGVGSQVETQVTMSVIREAACEASGTRRLQDTAAGNWDGQLRH